jgi:hypothetical protein
MSIDKAQDIETSLWAFSDVLLESVRSVYDDAPYTGNEWANARKFHDSLKRTLSKFPSLLALPSSSES